MKLLAALVAALLLAFAGAFSYVWYRTNTTIDEAVSALAPYAHISYGSIISSVYPGILGLADVEILLEGKRLHADSITVSALLVRVWVGVRYTVVDIVGHPVTIVISVLIRFHPSGV